MPIKFRCNYCNQLMGIAHRKAGMEVVCPTCKGKVLVPATSTEAPPQPGNPPAAPLFEQSDFGDFLNAPAQPEPVLAGAPQVAEPQVAPLPQPMPQPQPRPAGIPRPLRLPSDFEFAVEPRPGAMANPTDDPAAGGIVLSPIKATLLTVAIILGLAVAFSAGLLVGKAL
jgi:phage FluMu protein Com